MSVRVSAADIKGTKDAMGPLPLEAGTVAARPVLVPPHAGSSPGWGWGTEHLSRPWGQQGFSLHSPELEEPEGSTTHP